MLRGKKIILGVCGSIAAYKAAFLVRLLIKEEAEVKVVMTPSASSFISPLTLSTLSKNPAYSEFTRGTEGEWNNHVELGMWADLMVIAPASANTISKMANGLCDNLLSAVYLSAKCPVWVAPAMDLDMYQHPSVIANLQKLKSFANTIIDAEHGELASGLIGQGRMEEPEQIVERIKSHFSVDSKLKGKKVLVTAGPTCEPIDPVRFISNHSSGKMGYELAEALAKQGAEVLLVTGPTSLNIPAGVKAIHVKSASQMYDEVKKVFAETDLSIFAAAVADYTPSVVADKKIKKAENTFELHLEKTKDIAGEIGKLKRNGQVLVGFALETDNEMENARKKLESKNLDMIVLNSLQDKGAGFGVDTNKITIINRDNKTFAFELKSKKEAAQDIIKTLLQTVYA